jgi:hypothetical protein
VVSSALNRQLIPPSSLSTGKLLGREKNKQFVRYFLKITDYFLLQEVGYGITKETTFTLTNPQKESA